MPDGVADPMSQSRCPRCRGELGNYLYADACPHCGGVLEHNTRPLVPAPAKQTGKARPWPVRCLLKLRGLVEG